MKVLFIFTTIVISLLGFAGGGGSDSGGGSDFGGGASDYFGGGGDGEFSWEGLIFTLIVLVVAVLIVIISEKIDKRRERNKYLKEEQELNALDQNKTEQEKWIHEEAKRIFIQYQQDWSDYNLTNIKQYTTDRYFQHASLMLEAIDQMNRRNVIDNLSISKIVLYTSVNNETKLPITVKTMFRFSGTDSLKRVDNKRSVISNHERGVIEYWSFIYDGKTLKLNEISQFTESAPHLIESIAEFANKNNLFYSPDWGRLALPMDGLIFDNDKVLLSDGYNILKNADVNNHVVGKWKDCLVQIYTYSAFPGAPKTYYIVGQINVPKTYKGVIIKAKKGKVKVKRPKDYDEFDMEWGEFSRRYDVFAASKDALPAFELLNPAFMERLYDRNLPYSIEVKNNVIYIFAKVKEAKEEYYAELLDVLSEAFNELKM